MTPLKCCLHLHTRGDILDRISYTPEEAIVHASKRGFHVVAITCHDIVIWSSTLECFASKRGILLIPGIEKTVEKKHVLILNAHKESEHLKSFEHLGAYKKNHPESCIIAPHPFHLPPFPASFSLGKKLHEYSAMFDAIEFNYYYTRHLQFNAPAAAFAKKHAKPLIGTSDVHKLAYMDKTFCLVQSEKNIKSVIDAIKNGRVELLTRPLTLTELFKITAENFIGNPIKNLLTGRNMIQSGKHEAYRG